MNENRNIAGEAGNQSQGVAELLHELELPEDAAELRQLVELCRHSSRVRAWLFGSFAVSQRTQEAFRALLGGGKANDALWSPALRRLVESDPSRTSEGKGRHGGISETQILALIKRYQSGGLDASTVLLVRFWLRFCDAGRGVPAALWRPTLRHWDTLVRDSSGQMAMRLSAVIRFFQERSGRRIGEPDFGFTNSWRIHVLLYILDHPQRCYRVGELHDSLPAKYRHVGRKEIRTFCKNCGIRRDTRPGQREREMERRGLPALQTREDSR